MPAPSRPNQPDPGPEPYAAQSMRPWPVLLFLTPLIAAYEIGSLVYLADDTGRVTETVAARYLLAQIFELFGAFGLFLPGIALVVVLLFQHLLARDPWRVRPSTLAVMAAESAGLAVPLLVLAWTTQLLPLAATTPDAPLPLNTVGARLTIAVGAGIYEELVFRMIVIAVVHTVFTSVMRTSERTAGIFAILASATLFTLYHNLTPDGVFDWRLAAFFATSGIYFAVLYLWRGFGIIVAVHAIYDVIVLFPQDAHGVSP